MRSRLVTVAAAVFGWLVLRPIDAPAHARLVRADPPDPCAQLAAQRWPQPARPGLLCASGVVLAQPPRSVRLFFNERVQLVGRGVRVLGPTGRRVEQGPVRVSGTEVEVGLDASEPGTYRVLWRVVASDTHPAQGAVVFSVGHPSRPPGFAAGVPGAGRSTVGLALQTAARAIHFIGYALSFGVFAFRRAVLVPRSLTTDTSVERQMWRLIGAGILGLLAAEPIALIAQTVSLTVPPESPLDADVMEGALDSSFGLVLAQRAGAAVLIWVLAGAVRQAAIGEAAAGWAVLGLGAAVALIDREAAHAVAARPAWLGFGANALHESAMGWWVGAVLGLLGVWRLPGVAARRDEVVAATGRFAGPAVPVLVLSGVVMAAQHLGGLRDLAATAYGRTLAAKLCALGAGVALAGAAARAPAERRDRWWVREAAVLLSLLALAGLLVSLPPPV